MKPLIFWIPVLTFGLGSMQVGAQPAREFARLLPEAGAVDRLQRLEWQATGDHFDPGQTVVAGGYGRHTSSYTLQGTWEPSGQASCAPTCMEPSPEAPMEGIQKVFGCSMPSRAGPS